MTIQFTPKFGIPFPEFGDPPQVPTDMQAIAQKMDDILAALDAGYVPIGAMMMWSAAVAPARWLLCEGQQLDRLGLYAPLFAVIDTTYNVGTVPGSKFMLPDMRGRTPIGVDGSAARIAANDAFGQNGGEEKHVLLPGEASIRTHKHSGATGGENSSLAHSHSGTTGIENSSLAHGHGSPAFPVRIGGAGPWGTYAAGGGAVTVPYTGGSIQERAGVDAGGPPAHSHNFGTTSNGPSAHSHNLDQPSQAVVGGEINGSPHNIMQPYQVVNFVIRFA